MSPVGEAAGGLVDLVTSDEQRTRYLERGDWNDETLVDRVRQHARERGGAIAVVDQSGERRTSYAQLDAESDLVAAFLIEEGVVPGEVVAVQLPSWYEAVAIGIGVLKAGAIVNPMLPIYRERELEHMLGLVQTRFLFTASVYRGFDYRTLSLSDRVRSNLTQIVVDDPAGDGTGFLEAIGERAPQPLRQRAAHEVSELLFTSGTEAEPKAVLHTEQTANFAVRSAGSSIGLRPDDVVWMPSPIGHSTGFNMGLRMSIFYGLKLVLQDRWEPETAIALINDERCSYTSASPTFLKDVIRLGAANGADLSSLRLVRCGGAPVPASLVEEAAGLGIFVLRIYGSTEALSSTANRVDSPAEKRSNTDGRPNHGMEVQVRDEDGNAVEVGESGEVFVRGGSTAVGFLNDPVRTAEVFTPDGWVRTGDLGVMDGDGYLTIVGRKKEIIIRGGLNIAPREVEELLLEMPAVVAAAVVGIPDPRLGEIGCAFLVTDGTREVTFDEMVSHLRGRGLSAFKLPERLELVDALPMTPTGKVHKPTLTARIA